MLCVNDIRRSFRGRTVLDGVSFSLEPGTINGLIGPSGGGKSVLLKIIGGAISADGGEVCFEKEDSHDLSLMFQEGALFDSLDVYNNVAFPLVSGRVPTYILPRSTQDEVRDKVDAILERVGLRKASAKYPAQLSGGMRRRVSLARALVSCPRFVLLDDPIAGLDPVASSVIMDLISELHREFLPTTVIVTHDLRRLLPMVDTIYALFDGKIKFSGTLRDLPATDFEPLRRFVSCRYELEPNPN